MSSPWLPTDATAALRAKRYRQNKKTSENNTSVTVDAKPAHAVSTITMAALAGRLQSGTATIADQQLAGRLVLALMQLLPADATIDLGEMP
jgi:hypothetical protein